LVIHGLLGIGFRLARCVVRGATPYGEGENNHQCGYQSNGE
jgi:hypothetical protein